MNKEPLKIYTAAELAALPPSDEISDLLRVAADALDKGHIGSATWRLADACFLLRQRLTRQKATDVQGFDVPTGRGALFGGEPEA